MDLEGDGVTRSVEAPRRAAAAAASAPAWPPPTTTTSAEQGKEVEVEIEKEEDEAAATAAELDESIRRPLSRSALASSSAAYGDGGARIA
jgi:hypothetical protein